jgi:hypothetical protein
VESSDGERTFAMSSINDLQSVSDAAAGTDAGVTDATTGSVAVNELGEDTERDVNSTDGSGKSNLTAYAQHDRTA